jgi:hypothetical protein
MVLRTSKCHSQVPKIICLVVHSTPFVTETNRLLSTLMQNAWIILILAEVIVDRTRIVARKW